MLAGRMESSNGTSIAPKMPPLISHEVIIHLICGDHVQDSLEVKSA
jgi:hypothetical protein